MGVGIPCQCDGEVPHRLLPEVWIASGHWQPDAAWLPA